MRLSCRSQTSHGYVAKVFSADGPQADCVPRAEGCIAAACRSAKTTWLWDSRDLQIAKVKGMQQLVQRFQVNWRPSLPLTQFQGFVRLRLRQDSFTRLRQPKPSELIQALEDSLKCMECVQTAGERGAFWRKRRRFYRLTGGFYELIQDLTPTR